MVPDDSGDAVWQSQPDCELGDFSRVSRVKQLK